MMRFMELIQKKNKKKIFFDFFSPIFSCVKFNQIAMVGDEQEEKNWQEKRKRSTISILNEWSGRNVEK